MTFHDAFVTDLREFPKFSEMKKIIIAVEKVSSFPSWQQLIAQEGSKALSIFSECTTKSAGFKSIDKAKEFLLTNTYPRTNEHHKFATLCKRLLISNTGFEAGLAEVQSGWPIKRRIIFLLSISQMIADNTFGPTSLFLSQHLNSA